MTDQLGRPADDAAVPQDQTIDPPQPDPPDVPDDGSLPDDGPDVTDTTANDPIPEDAQ